MLRLISATPSPYARKVRIALIEKNIPFELITEVPWNQGAITEQHNPLAKLPVLILEDGSSIFDSRFILEYLELIYPQTPLLFSDVPERLMAKSWKFWRTAYAMRWYWCFSRECAATTQVLNGRLGKCTRSRLGFAS